MADLEPKANPLWGPDWPNVRAMWPLEGSAVHLNHGSYGAVPIPVLEEQRSWCDRLEQNPVRFYTRELQPALQEARAEVARFLGTEAAGLAFVSNATAGVSSVLAGFPLEPGDEVLLTDHAYGAVLLAAQRFTSRARASVVTASVALDAGADEAARTVLDSVTDRTRLVILDHVTSATARRLPVESLVPELQRRGVAVLVDAAHSPGMLDVSVAGLGADFWTGTLHKWCCAPRGTAVLCVAPEWRERVHALVVSWYEPLGFPYSFDLPGTIDASAWLAAPRAIRLLEQLGWQRLRQHNVDLAVHGQNLIGAAVGLDAAELPRDAAVSMQLVPLPAGVADTVEQAVDLQARIGETAGVEVAVTCWRARGFLRISAHAYNAPADYERLAELVPALI